MRRVSKLQYLFGSILAVLLSASLLRAQAASGGSAPDDVVMTVGDTKITAAQFEKIASNLPPQLGNALQTLGKKGFADQLANLVILSKEAERRGLDKTEQFQQMMEFQREMLLAQVAMNSLASEVGVSSPEEVGYYYQTHQDEFQQLRVTGIFIPFATGEPRKPGNPLKPTYTPQQAQRRALELRARINAGESMAALAKTESQHPTASKGGDFGFVSRAQLPPNIATAVFALARKRVSAPIKDSQGYYLFRVEDSRLQPLSEVQDSIQQSLTMQRLNRVVEKMKESYPITLNEAYFAEPPAAASGAPSQQ